MRNGSLMLPMARAAAVTAALLLLTGCASKPAPVKEQAAATPLTSRNTISVFYFSQVECQADRSRPLQLDRIEISDAGNDLYGFTDKRTRKTFRDGAAVTAQFAQLARNTNTPRSAASKFTVPAEFRSVTRQPTLYLTASQRKQAESLHAEIRAWRALLSGSTRILSSADLEPKATVVRMEGNRPAFGVQITPTPGGAKRLADFTARHRYEVLGVVIDPEQPDSRLMMAPTVVGTITPGSTLQVGVFRSHGDARKLAEHLNRR